MKKYIYITIAGFYVGSTAILDALEDNNFSVQFGDFDILRSKYGLLKLGNTKSKLTLIRCYLYIILECKNIIFSIIKLIIKRRVLKKYSKREYYSLYNNWRYSYKIFISIISFSSKIFIKRFLCKSGLSENNINFEKLIYLYSIYSNKNVFHNCHDLKNHNISDYKLTTFNKYKIKYIVVTRNPIDQLSTALDFHVKDINDNRFANVLKSETDYYDDHIFRLKYVTEIALNMARRRLNFLEKLSKIREIKVISFEELVSSNNYRKFLSNKFPEHKFLSYRNFQFIQKESSKNLFYTSKTLSREKIYEIIPSEIEELTKINSILREKF
tara:strand:+ start:10719 stop:11699 length:981 start_codon:yes stop_codon:yes gene_type:complete